MGPCSVFRVRVGPVWEPQWFAETFAREAFVSVACRRCAAFVIVALVAGVGFVAAVAPRACAGCVLVAAFPVPVAPVACLRVLRVRRQYLS